MCDRRDFFNEVVSEVKKNCGINGTAALKKECDPETAHRQRDNCDICYNPEEPAGGTGASGGAGAGGGANGDVVPPVVPGDSGGAGRNASEGPLQSSSPKMAPSLGLVAASTVLSLVGNGLWTDC